MKYRIVKVKVKSSPRPRYVIQRKEWPYLFHRWKFIDTVRYCTVPLAMEHIPHECRKYVKVYDLTEYQK